MDEHDIEWLLTKVIELEKDKEYKEFFEKFKKSLDLWNAVKRALYFTQKRK